MEEGWISSCTETKAGSIVKGRLLNPTTVVRPSFLIGGSSTTRLYPVTWGGLYELLDDSELGDVAEELRTAMENAVTVMCTKSCSQ